MALHAPFQGVVDLEGGCHVTPSVGQLYHLLVPLVRRLALVHRVGGAARATRGARAVPCVAGLFNVLRALTRKTANHHIVTNDDCTGRKSWTNSTATAPIMDFIGYVCASPKRGRGCGTHANPLYKLTT